MTRKPNHKVRKYFAGKQVTCPACGKPLDFDTPYPEPDFVTTDHIIPKSKGGKDSYKNLQLMHLACNFAKGSTLPSQRLATK